MRFRLVKEPFDHPDYLFELKHDGFRTVAYLQNGECKLISRNLKHLHFERLEQVLSPLPVQNAIFDGEIVCVDHGGVSRFNDLLNRKANPSFYVFDMLWMNGEDLRCLPLVERKSRLAQLVKASGCQRILYAQHIEGEGKAFFAEICTRDLEGIVGKRKLGIYKDGGNGWLKIKNRSYSQAEGRHELLSLGSDRR
jgi:bifunctional non-homologous end joining protein LigD